MFKVVKLQRLVPNIHLMEVEAPEVAEQVQPGQFVIVRAADGGERIPLSVADWDRQAGTVTLVFMEVGVSTGRLARLKAGGSIPTVAGPLGRPTAIAAAGQRVVCVAGCYGIASMLPIVRALHEAGAEVTVVLEARSRFLLYWEDRMRAFAKRVITITRDGSSRLPGPRHRPAGAPARGRRHAGPGRGQRLHLPPVADLEAPRRPGRADHRQPEPDHDRRHGHVRRVPRHRRRRDEVRLRRRAGLRRAGGRLEGDAGPAEAVHG